jgi:hypothetical protein
MGQICFENIQKNLEQVEWVNLAWSTPNSNMEQVGWANITLDISRQIWNR